MLAGWDWGCFGGTGWFLGAIAQGSTWVRHKVLVQLMENDRYGTASARPDSWKWGGGGRDPPLSSQRKFYQIPASPACDLKLVNHSPCLTQLAACALGLRVGEFMRDLSRVRS